MWIILFFVCLGVIFPNRAQELTSSGAQTVTESPNTNYGVNWDTTKPPVTLSIRDGRADNSNRLLNENPDHQLFYSNQWRPLLMPIEFNSNGDNKSHQTENEYFMDHQFVPTFLRRPDSEPNKTVSSNRYPIPAERNEFLPVPIPLAPITFYPPYPNLYSNGNSHEVNTDNKQNFSISVPITSHSVISGAEERYSEILPDRNLPEISKSFRPYDFYRYAQGFTPPLVPALYPTQSNLFSNGNNQGFNMDNKQLSSTTVSKPVTSDSVISIAKERYSEMLPAEKFSPIPEGFQPMPFNRNTHGFIPPMSPSFFPSYPFLPFTRDGTIQPMMPYPTTDPNFDREGGSEPVDSVQDVQERQVVPGNVQDHSAENIPSETSSDIVPPQPLTFPTGVFPFGVLPPHFVPPLIPNVPASGLPLNPLPVPLSTNVQRENIITDPMPPSPIITTRLPLESTPDVLPQVDYIEPEIGLVTASQVAPREVVPNEKPNADIIPYEFGFDMNDGKGTDQHRKEVSDGSGVVTGSYGYRDVYGVYRLVNYIADKRGFRAFIKSNEPGVASSGSADVVVMAERPPPHAKAEGIKVAEPEVVVPGETTDLLIAVRNTESKKI